jgi:hypothetical protein
MTADMTTGAGLLLVNLRVVGLLMAGLVVLNLFVPRRFNWREELARVSLLNRQIFQVHAFFLILTLALMAALLLTSAEALLEPTRLARALLGGLTLFWAARMLAQWCYYSPAVWRGNRLHTTMHVLFSAMWMYVTGVFGAALYFVAVR